MILDKLFTLQDAYHAKAGRNTHITQDAGMDKICA